MNRARSRYATGTSRYVSGGTYYRGATPSYGGKTTSVIFVGADGRPNRGTAGTTGH